MKVKSRVSKRIKLRTSSLILAIMVLIATVLIFPTILYLRKASGRLRENVTGTRTEIHMNRNIGESQHQQQKNDGNRQPQSGKTSKDPRYFMVFSTGCTKFQDWQGVSFFHFAQRVNQRGNVTRILSGCKDYQIDKQRKDFQEFIAPLSPRFSLHITPDYGVRDSQKYWNKPHGLLDWMEKELGFPDRAHEYENDIIMILDPDMMLLRPVTHYFTNHPTKWLTPKITDKVVRGTPVAQAYGFGASWLTSLHGKLEEVVGPDSPALKVTEKEAHDYYPAGPPYLAIATDMYDIAVHWVKFLPRVHNIFPEFMAEMHAYCIAAAHLKLPHQLAKGFMLSDVAAAHKEAFDFLEGFSRRDACLPDVPVEKLPFVMHFCQRYAVGRWFFSKYKLREDFFSCKAPLLREPPKNVGELYDWHIFPNGINQADYSEASKQPLILYHTWMLCTVLFSLNEVAIDYKTRYCGSTANFNKTWHFQDEELFEYALRNTSNPFLIEDIRTRIRMTS